MNDQKKSRFIEKKKIAIKRFYEEQFTQRNEYGKRRGAYVLDCRLDLMSIY